MTLSDSVMQRVRFTVVSLGVVFASCATVPREQLGHVDDKNICPLHLRKLTTVSGFTVDGFFSADVSDKEYKFRERNAPRALEFSQSLEKRWIYTKETTLTYCEECEDVIRAR